MKLFVKSIFTSIVFTMLLGASLSHAWDWPWSEENIEYGKEQAGKAYEYGSEQAGKAYEFGSEQAGKAYEFGSEQAGKAYEFGSEQASKAYEAWQEGRTVEYGKEQAGKAYEYGSEQAGKAYEFGKTQAGKAAEFFNPSGQKSMEERLGWVPVYIVNGSYKSVSIELNKEWDAKGVEAMLHAALRRAEPGFVGYAGSNLATTEVRIKFNGEKRGMVRLKNEKSAYALVDEIEGDNGRFYQVLIKVEPIKIEYRPTFFMSAIKLSIDQVIMVR